jgi:glycopeptide antibiotics resistance protein
MDLFDDPFRFFLNIAPNLFGSFLIPFGAYWFFSGRNFMIARVFRLESPYELKLVCLLGMAMLLVNEYLQLIPLFGRTFDYNDLIFSFIGLMISYLIFGRFQQRFKPLPG